MSSHTQKQTQVDAQRSDVRSGLTRHVEHGKPSLVVKLDQSGRVDGSDSELSLDGGDEGGSLEKRTGEGLESSGESLLVLERSVDPQHGHVLLSGRLLGLNQSGRSVDADDQATGNLGIQRSRVTGLLGSEDSSKPGNDFVGGRVGGLVKVNDSRPKTHASNALEHVEASFVRKYGTHLM